VARTRRCRTQEEIPVASTTSSRGRDTGMVIDQWRHRCGECFSLSRCWSQPAF
jgi:hypothetical protein